MTSATRVLAFNATSPSGADASLGESSEALQLLVGPSSAAAHLWAQVRRVAPHFRTALLTGEAGTGAEAVARALHDLSPAVWRSFLALTPGEAENYFDPKNLGSSSSLGTIFLTDVENLSRTAQSGLLRVLRNRGPNAVRLVAFASRGLRPLVSTGTFSAELANSLAAVRITLPALRERTEDIPMLASYLLQRRAQQLGYPARPLTPEFLKTAVAYAWPGNLDQMSATLDRLLTAANGDVLQATDIEAAAAACLQVSAPATLQPRMIKLDQVVQEHIRAVLFGCNGNKLRAAEVLGISRSTLYRMLEASTSSYPLSLAG